jgi:polyketide cyclase/dehydrase/lipid transport protein
MKPRRRTIDLSRLGLAAMIAIVPAGAAAYVLVVRGALTLDLRLGRRVRPLGPIQVEVAAPPETLFDVIAEPYLGKTPRAMRSKLEVLERGSDMVLASHYTPAGGLTATTVETVRFERPDRISFRLLRGPVPHVLERFELRASDRGTELTYTGELGTDLWQLGQWWGDRVARTWESTVEQSLHAARAEAERRASRQSS